jgi:predicted transposase YbfD/YdcC
MGDIKTHFRKVTDKRQKQGKRHKLIDIIAIAICGIICGADDWVMIEQFGIGKEKWFRKFLELPHGIPSHDTIGKVFSWIDPEEFHSCFMDWVREIAVVTKGELIAIDGKTVRRSHDRTEGEKAIHIVSAWASQNEMVIGQKKVADKSNEITAIPELLKMLDISGCIVTIDAIGTQKTIINDILKKKADYLLAVKKNQGKLYEQVKHCFEVDQKNDFEDAPYDFARTVNKGHGRIETRKCWVVTDPDYLAYIDPEKKWQGLKSVAIIESVRKIGEASSAQTRYFISSLETTAKHMLKCIRGHWEVENKLHWNLDVSFREDESRVRKGHAQENLTIVRKLALNLLRKNKSRKGGAKTKRLICAIDTDFLLDVLNS